MYCAAPVIFLVLTAIAAWYVAKQGKTSQDRSKQHLCLTCGYNLRATPERCPECGAKPFRHLDRIKLRNLRVGSRVAVPLADMGQENLTLIHETTEREEAKLLVGQLKSRGIPARRADTQMPGHPFLVLFKVQVRKEDREISDAIICEFGAK